MAKRSILDVAGSAQMCGIAGVISRHADPSVRALAESCSRQLAHRGPDGAGIWCDRWDASAAGESSVALAHRRLSIVDLVTGDQPMSNEDGSVWVTFNGEIYNHADLRPELERRGHRFVTRADTEVLVHGWEEWGVELFGRLNGIFAIAIGDRRQRRLVLARDPIGVKPLYVGVGPNRTWWSSELRAAAEAGFCGEIDTDALKLFLAFRFIPSPYAPYRNVRKLPPGHYVDVPSDHAGEIPTFRRYHTAIRSAANPRSTIDWEEAIRDELALAVRRQMMSDVPIGILLSGGVDSSVVASLMCRTGERPQAFAIGLTGEGAIDETVAAERASRALNIPLRTVRVGADHYARALPHAIAHLGEPIANSGTLLVQLLCQEVRATHKVVLTGQGADEPLGGYPRHVAERMRGAGRLAPRLSAWVAQHVIGGDAGERVGRALATADPIDRMVATLGVVPPDAIDRYVRNGTAPAAILARDVLSPWFAESDPRDSLNALLYVDARTSLADDLLLVADHFSMQASVELRVPFLDLALLELLERMPGHLKISRFGERKWLYRRVARDLLPEPLSSDVAGWRARIGRKRGFTTPTEQWFVGGALSDWRQWPGARQLDSVIDAASALRDPELVSPRSRLTMYALAGWLASTADS